MYSNSTLRSVVFCALHTLSKEEIKVLTKDQRSEDCMDPFIAKHQNLLSDILTDRKFGWSLVMLSSFIRMLSQRSLQLSSVYYI
jgi:hypothetical protein